MSGAGTHHACCCTALGSRGQHLQPSALQHLQVLPLQLGKGKVVKVHGIKGQGATATVLLRGSNKLVLEEAERSLHDALCVVRCLVHKRALIAGGAAPEVEVTTQLSRWAKELQVSCFSQAVAQRSAAATS